MQYDPLVFSSNYPSILYRFIAEFLATVYESGAYIHSLR